MNPEFESNVISIGVSLESQMRSLLDFIKKKKKNKTVILLPKNQYTDFLYNYAVFHMTNLSQLFCSNINF